MMEEEPKRKHVVLSFGTGGYQIARTIDRCTREAGVDGQWNYGVVDSASIPVDEFPDNFEVVPLQRDDRMAQIFNQLLNNDTLPWAHRDLTLANQGATRDPGIGRFYTEYHSHRIYRQLKSMIESVIDENTDDELTVWLCSSFAGGTGAGSFPLMSVLVDEIVSDIATATGIDAGVLGIGCVSQLNLPQRTVPGPDSVYYLNSNVVLHEMATLLDIETETGMGRSVYPLDIEMPAAPEPSQASALRSNTRSLESPPLEALFLTPIDEERADSSTRSNDETESYVEQVNWSMAMTVLAVAHADMGLDNLFDQTLVDRLYTFDTVDIRAPVEAAQRSFDIADTLESIEDRIADTNSSIDELESLIEGYELLNEAITPDDSDDETTIGGAPDPETVGDVSPVVSSAFDDARRRIDAMTLEDADAQALSAEASTFATSVAPADDDRIDHELIAEYAFYQLAYAALEARIETSPFAERVFDLYEKNRGALGEFQDVDKDDPVEESGDVDSGDPVGMFEQVIEPYLLDSIGSIESMIDSTSGARFRKVRRLRKRRDEVESTLEQLREARDTYEKRQNTLDLIETQCFAALRRRLSDRIVTAQSTLAEHESTLTELENRRSDRETERSTVTDQLTSGSHGRIATVPFELETTDDLSQETIENADHLYDLIDAGVLSEETLAEYVHDALVTELEEPLEDTVVIQSKPGELFVPITHPENAQVFDDSSVETARKGRDIHTHLSVSHIESPFAISLVTLFDNIQLDNASEFHHISEHWREDSLVELFGEEVELWPQVAYPELFSPGEPVALPPGDRFVGRDERTEPLVEDGGEQ